MSRQSAWWRRSFGVLLPLIRPGAARLGIGLSIGAGLAVALGLLYPVQRSVDLAPYALGGYDVQAEALLMPSDLDRVKQDFGPDSVFVSALWDAPLATGSGRRADITLILTGTPGTEDLSLFPPGARMASADVGDDAWIDLDAGLAKHLGVSPGDRVVVPANPVHAVITFRVRSVYAARLVTAEYSAIAPSAPAFAATAGTDEERYFNLLVRGRTVEQVRAVLGQDFYRQRLASVGFGDPTVTSRRQLLDQAGELSSASLGLIRVMAALALLGGIGLMVREGDVFRRSVVADVVLLTRLGWRPGRSVATVGLTAGLVALVAVGVGVLLAVRLYTMRILGAGLPPELRPVLTGVVAAGWVAVAAVLALGLVRLARRGAAG